MPRRKVTSSFLGAETPSPQRQSKPSRLAFLILHRAIHAAEASGEGHAARIGAGLHRLLQIAAFLALEVFAARLVQTALRILSSLPRPRW